MQFFPEPIDFPLFLSAVTHPGAENTKLLPEIRSIFRIPSGWTHRRDDLDRSLFLSAASSVDSKPEPEDESHEEGGRAPHVIWRLSRLLAGHSLPVATLALDKLGPPPPGDVYIGHLEQPSLLCQELA